MCCRSRSVFAGGITPGLPLLLSCDAVFACVHHRVSTAALSVSFVQASSCMLGCGQQQTVLRRFVLSSVLWRTAVRAGLERLTVISCGRVVRVQ